MTPLEAVEAVKKRFPFKGYMSQDVRVYLDAANTLMPRLAPGAKILDFGCGSCDKTAILQMLGFQCSGFDDLEDHWHKLGDNRQKILEFATEVGIEFHLARGGPLPYQRESFDAVILEAVIEHLHNSPRDLLNDLVELIKPEGYLYITVPNAVNIRKHIHVMLGRTNYARFPTYYWYPDPWRGHVREYTKGDLSQLAGLLHLDILELHGCHHMLGRLGWRRIPYLCVTRFFTGWRDSWLMLARKPKGWTPHKLLPDEELKKILGTVNPYSY